jgi:hypothetical protein
MTIMTFPNEPSPSPQRVRHQEVQLWLARAPQRVRRDPRVQRMLAEITHYEQCLIQAQQDHAANRPIPSLTTWLHQRAGFVVLGMLLLGGVAILNQVLLVLVLALSALGMLAVLGRISWRYALRSRERRALIQRYQDVLKRYRADLIQLANTLQGD